MSTSGWYYPTKIVQYAEQPDEQTGHIPWTNPETLSILGSNYITTDGFVYRTSRYPKADLTTKTYFLQATVCLFENLTDPIKGIELKLDADRGGRVMDETVQLCLKGQLIGENQANTEVRRDKVYGGETDMWGLKALSPNSVMHNQFGVWLRFKSHDDFPHYSAVTISSIQLRVHY